MMELRDSLMDAPGATVVRQPRIGFLGVGWIGRNRMEALIRSGKIEAAGIADTDAELADTARMLAPEACIENGLEGLLRAGLDAVVIATPSALHATQAVQALEAGCAVFCQKPLGRNAAETRRVIDAARANDVLLGVDLSYRHVRGVEVMRGLIASGEIGRPFAVNLVFHNAYGPDKPWFYDPALSGGGCLIDLGIHLVDLVLHLLPDVRVTGVEGTLFSKGSRVDRRSQVEDFAGATIQLEGGIRVDLTCSWHLHAGRDAVIEASIYGTSGGLALHNVDGSFYDFVVSRSIGTSREVLSEPPDDWGGRAALAWVTRLVEDPSFDPEILRLVPVVACLDAIYEKATIHQ